MIGGDQREWRSGDRDCRWRQAQRNRRRRWTRRGLATLAVCFGLVAVASLFTAWEFLFRPAPIKTAAVVAVGSAPKEQLTKPPRHLFERPPVTDRVLDLEIVVNELGFDRFTDSVPFLGSTSAGVESLRVQYTLDTELTRHVFKTLSNGRVALGHVILLDPNTGRVLAYASTDVERFPPTRTYPAASLVKIITAAAALDRDRGLASLPCRYQGSPYALPRSRIDPPKKGLEVSLRKALASSYNQCFAQLAVHVVGGAPLMDAISRFGWLSSPAPAHPAGTADLGEDLYDIGKLGCGLAGSHITPLHAAQLAATLARGELVEPHWIEAVYGPDGRELPIPAPAAPRQVITAELAAELRGMLTDTTLRGTARRAFRKRNGRPMLGPVKVAGKTGSLSGTNPTGRYEWFVGVAPAEDPRIAVAVLLVQSDLWWRNASQIAAEVLQGVFCEGRHCRPELVGRWIRVPTATAARLDYAAEALN